MAPDPVQPGGIGGEPIGFPPIGDPTPFGGGGGGVEPPLGETTFTRVDFTTGTARVLSRIRFHGKTVAGVDHEYVWSGHVVPDATKPAEARVMSFGYSDLSLSGPSGDIRVNTCRVSLVDNDRLLRGFLSRFTQYGLINAEAEIEVIKEADWRAGYTWMTVFRGEVARYKPEVGFLFSLELNGWGTRRLARKFPLPKLRTDFTAIASASRDLYAPLLMGQKSDEGSAATGPTLVLEPSTGAGDGAPEYYAGHGSLGGTVPTGFFPVENVGAGSLPAGVYIGRVTTVDGSGNESDPDTFLDSASTQLTVGDNAAITMTCTNMGGGLTYRFYLGTYYYGVRWHRMIASGSPTATFTALDHTSESVEVFSRYAFFVAWAVLADGKTSPTSRVRAVNIGYRRPWRFVFTAVSGALEYKVAQTRQGATNTAPSDFDQEFTVPPTQTTGTGDIYFEDDLTAAVAIDSLTVPRGKVPVVPIGGAYTNAPTGIQPAVTDWQFFLVSYGCGKTFHGFYQVETVEGEPVTPHYHPDPENPEHTVATAGTVVNAIQVGINRVPASEFVAGGNWAAPGWGDWDGLFGSQKYLEIGGRRYWGFYVRGQDAADALSGVRPIYVNATGVELIGDGSSTAIISGVDQLSWTIDNFFSPDAPQSVAGGPWVTSNLWSDGVARRDLASFILAANEIDEVLGSLARSYYIPATDQAGRLTNADVLRDMLLGLDLGLGWLVNGQITVVLHPPAPDSAIYVEAVVDHVGEILDDPPFEIDDDETQRFTRQPYTFAFDEISQAFLTSDFVDNPTVTNVYHDTDPIDAPTLQLPTVEDATVAANIANRSLRRVSRPERTVTVPRAFHVIGQKLGTRFLLTHPEGIGDVGYVAEPMQIRRVLPDTNRLVIVHGCHDLGWFNLLLSAPYSLELLEEYMAARSLGGHYEQSLVADGGVIYFNDRRFARVDWPFFSSRGVTVTGIAHIWMATDAGTVTPAIYDEGGALIATGTPVSSATFVLQTISVPAAGVEKFYHVRPTLAGGATILGAKGFGELDPVPV